MNDGYEHPNSVDARLAVLEEQVRAFNTRLNVVSDRAYELTGSMRSVLTGQEEAHEQRTDLVAKVGRVETTLNALVTTTAVAARSLSEHERVCDRRSARIEKLGWTMLSAILGICGFLAAQFFARVFAP